MIALTAIPYPFPWGIVVGGGILLALAVLSYFHGED
jgi:hypothetical protein